MKLLLGSGFFIGGVAVGGYAGFQIDNSAAWLAVGIIFAGIAIATAGLLFKRTTAGVIALLGVVFMCGLIRGGTVDLTEPGVIWGTQPAEGTRLTVVGRLLEDPAPAGNGNRLRLTAEKIRWDGQATEAPIIVDAFADRLLGEGDRAFDGFRYGDLYSATGTFKPYPEGAGAVGFVSTGGVFLLEEGGGNPVRAWLGKLRETLSTQLARIMQGDPAALAAAMTVGDRRRLSPDISEAFRTSGLSHVLAISGLHLSVIGGILLAVSAAALGKRRQFYLIVPLAGIWGYAALAGMSPSVARAAGMFTILLAAHALGRQRDSLPALGFVGGVMVAFTPSLLASLSFQLSFAAVAGIATFTPLATEWWGRRFAEKRTNIFVKRGEWIYSSMATSLGATIMTVPVVASTIGVTPLLSPIATLFALPALPFFIIASLAASAIGTVWVEAGQIISWPAWVAGSYTILLAKTFAAIPHGTIASESWTVWAVIGWYSAVGGFYFRQTIKKQITRIWNKMETLPGPVPTVPVWGVCVLAAIAAVVWAVTWTAQDGEVTIHFYETSIGDMILVRSPDGATVLIDGGRSAGEAVAALDSTLPFWKRSIDMVVLTHPDADHLGGLAAVLDRYNVGVVMDSASQHQSALAREWQRKLAQYPGEVIRARDGMLIGLAGGGTFEVLWAGASSPNAPINDASTVMMLRYGEVSVLFTGDISSDVETRLAEEEGQNIRATVLKVAHHGSNTSSDAGFLEAVSPAAAVIQAGRWNRFGHPTENVLSKLGDVVNTEQIWVTKDAGEILLRTDGVRVSIEGLGATLPPGAE